MPKTSQQEEYNPHKKEEREAKKQMEDSGMMLAIAGVILVLVWLGRKYLVNSKKDSE